MVLKEKVAECFFSVIQWIDWTKISQTFEFRRKERNLWRIDRFEKLVKIDDCYKNCVLKIIIKIIKGIMVLKKKIKEYFLL